MNGFDAKRYIGMSSFEAKKLAEMHGFNVVYSRITRDYKRDRILFILDNNGYVTFASIG